MGFPIGSPPHSCPPTGEFWRSPHFPSETTTTKRGPETATPKPTEPELPHRNPGAMGRRDMGFAWGSSAPHHWDLWGGYGVCRRQLSPTSLGSMGWICDFHGAAQPHIVGIYRERTLRSMGQIWGLHGAAQPHSAGIYGEETLGPMGQTWGSHGAAEGWPHRISGAPRPTGPTGAQRGRDVAEGPRCGAERRGAEQCGTGRGGTRGGSSLPHCTDLWGQECQTPESGPMGPGPTATPRPTG